MSDQYLLFGGTPPSVRHSETSKAAAEAVKDKIGPMHRRMIEFLTGDDEGATDEEMQKGIPLAPNTQRPRRRELQLMGRIKDSGLTRTGASGRAAVVWVLA